MANVNINRNLSDQFYRYKMPKLVAKVEGKGNGIKTVIVNMPEIAKSLNRPPMYPTKYFGCLLGAQVNFDNKSERYIVNGAHDPNKLQDLLDGFIQKYVLCQSCENPETILSVNKKKEIIGTNCMACGHSGTIPVATDRVAAYILKNPPPKPVAAAAPTAAAAAAAADSASGPTVDINSSAADDEDWGEETDADAVRNRLNQLSTGTKNLMLNDDLEKSQVERMQILYEFVVKKSEQADLTVGENQKAIKAEADRLDICDKAVIVLCEVLLKGLNFPTLIEKIKLYQNLFLRFTHANDKAQRYLLRGIELTISSMKEQLMPKVTLLLKRFYDLDIIEEKAFIEWFEKSQKKGSKLDGVTQEIIEKSKPFITWLNEASEESASADEEEVDVDFDDRIVGDAIKVTEQADRKESQIGTNVNTSAASSSSAGRKTNDKSKTVVESQAAAANKSPKQDDEDELDIDAI